LDLKADEKAGDVSMDMVSIDINGEAKRFAVQIDDHLRTR